MLDFAYQRGMTYAELETRIAKMSRVHRNQKVMVRDNNGNYFAIDKIRTPALDILDRGYVYLEEE